MEKNNNLIVKYYPDDDTAVRCIDSKFKLLSGAVKGEIAEVSDFAYSFDSQIIACELLVFPKNGLLESEEKKFFFSLVLEKGQPTYELVFFAAVAGEREGLEEYQKLELNDEKVFEIKHIKNQ